MSSSDNFLFLLKEYEKIKDEQYKRIEFRDHMIYLTLAAIGAVFSFALEKPDWNVALLVLPFLCIVLGWTYLSNDEKISAIGSYIRTCLVPKISELDTNNKLSLEGNWEEYLMNDKRRRHRKLFQLLIDLAVFCFSGVISIVAFYKLHADINWYFVSISILEFLFLLYLIFQFVKYADLSKKP